MAELRAMMLDQVRVFTPRAPLYARLATGIADRPDVLAILAEAPRSGRVPVTLFAAIHYLLLAQPQAELAAWFPDLAVRPRTDDPLPALDAFAAANREALVELVRTRVPQTNEVGRCAVLLVGLASVFAEVGPLAQLDVGASAGLNLLADRYAYDYAGHRLGEGRVRLSCGIRGPQRTELLPAAVPAITARLGLDRSPVDLADPDAVRWLEACVWPDQADRLSRLRAAIGTATAAGVRVRPGDALTDLPTALAELGTGHPVVTTSWVLAYLGEAQQRGFAGTLDALGRERDLSWLVFEEPSATTGLDWPEKLSREGLSVLRLIRWRNGTRTEEFLAGAHPHGYWLSWL